MARAVERIGVIGAGSWGTALASLFGDKGILTTLWGHDPERVERLRANRMSDYLPDVHLSPAIHPTASLAEAAEAEVILFVTPSKAFREVARQLSAIGPRPETILLSCTKGIENGTGLRMSEVLKSVFPANPVAVLSGPNHATEVARRMPTAAVAAASDGEVAHRLQELCSTRYFRLYTSRDVAGVELGGALKNIFAISAGVTDGLGLGDNSKAALVTRSLAEMIRLGIALGGRRETFQGLSGIGDLMVTCFSKHSRNRGVGERLGKGESISAITSSMKMVAEGVPTTLSSHECARRLSIQTPIIDQAHAVLYENKSPRAAMMELLSRDPRPEEDD